jgi:hypothetical protein
MAMVEKLEKKISAHFTAEMFVANAIKSEVIAKILKFSN